ncbi:hypothetical protein [Candidatus Poriferisocius sp.]|uniref:hypothetical protein n=1 Tax=Candidatus Poriferisocius sp. TaxID=3101276 RepID=UPI003B52CA06
MRQYLGVMLYLSGLVLAIAVSADDSFTNGTPLVAVGLCAVIVGYILQFYGQPNE